MLVKCLGVTQLANQVFHHCSGRVVNMDESESGWSVLQVLLDKCALETAVIRWYFNHRIHCQQHATKINSFVILRYGGTIRKSCLETSICGQHHSSEYN